MLPQYQAASAVRIVNAETVWKDGYYAVNADIDYELSDKVSEALRNGIALLWNYEIQVCENREFLWDKTVSHKSSPYRIQFNSLLNLYRVKNEASGAVNHFSSLDAAFDLLSTFRDFPAIDKVKLENGQNYFVKMKINFERDALPLPLRLSVYFDSQWSLSSDWYVWPLKD